MNSFGIQIARFLCLWPALLVALVLASCSKEQARPQSKEAAILVIPEGFPEMPFPEDNTFSRERWKLGKKLFYDKVLSADGSISCGHCHQPDLAFSDGKPKSTGVAGRLGSRNAPSLANVGYHPYYLREGGVPSLEMQALVPVQEHAEFDHDMLSIAQKLQADPQYREMSLNAYNRPPDPFVITRALATFQRSLISGESAFDDYTTRNDPSALSESQKRGMELFFSEQTQCSHCHAGFDFTNYSFKNNGLYQEYDDPGRMRLTTKAEDEALFKVPSLRNVELTAPYMHDGSLASLVEVVEHYNQGGKNHPHKSDKVRPLQLSAQEKADLVAFLKSLTDWDFVNNSRYRPLP